MANPVDFAGANKVFNPAPGTESYVHALPVHTNGIENIFCVKLSPEELAQVNQSGGEIWCSVRSGDVFYPMAVSGLPMMYAQDLDTGEEAIYYSDGRHVVEDARRYATLHHGEQWYDEERKLRHTYHLGKVHDVLADFGASWQSLATAWLHDIEEDCWQDEEINARRQRVGERYGSDIETVVWAVTGEMFIDGIKQNRKARNQQQYAKIGALSGRLQLHAAMAKVADRTANVEACIEFESPQGSMYLDEALDFDDHVGLYAPLRLRRRLLTGTVKLLEMHGPSKRYDPQMLTARLRSVVQAIQEATALGADQH